MSLSRPRSITLRISLLFGGLAALVLLVMGYLILVSVNHHFIEQDSQAVAGKLELLQNILAGPEGGLRLEKLQDALVGHHELSVQVRTGKKMLFQSGAAEFPQPLWQAVQPWQPGQPLVLQQWTQGQTLQRGLVVHLHDHAGQAVFQVAIAVDAHHHTHFMTRFKLQLLLVGGTGLLVLALLGWLVARRGLQPVSQMAQVAEGISAQRLQERLQLATLPAELHSLAISFNDMLDRLESSLRRLSDFASDIAHELRTPINNLMTQTQVSLSRSRSADEYREILYSNLEEYERLARMIADMLFLAKADNGLVIPRQEKIDLADEVRALFDFYEALAADKQLQLQVGGAARVQGDRLMLQRALGNLLSNAIRHSHRNSTVTVEITCDGDHARLTLCNQGDSIAAPQLERIFDRFYRADTSRTRSDEGAGLGLAITRSIIQAHRGQISARSEQGRTCFSLSLPIT